MKPPSYVGGRSSELPCELALSPMSSGEEGPESPAAIGYVLAHAPTILPTGSTVNRKRFASEFAVLPRGMAADGKVTQFGKRLRETRLAMGLGQEKLAKLAGLKGGGGYVSKLETGKLGQRISPEYIGALARVLGVNHEWLATGEGAKQARSTEAPKDGVFKSRRLAIEICVEKGIPSAVLDRMYDPPFDKALGMPVTWWLEQVAKLMHETLMSGASVADELEAHRFVQSAEATARHVAVARNPKQPPKRKSVRPKAGAA